MRFKKSSQINIGAFDDRHTAMKFLAPASSAPVKHILSQSGLLSHETARDQRLFKIQCKHVK